MSFPVTFKVDGHVRIMRWQDREQPYTIWRRNEVWYFASNRDEAFRLAAQARASRAA